MFSFPKTSNLMFYFFNFFKKILFSIYKWKKIFNNKIKQKDECFFMFFFSFKNVYIHMQDRFLLSKSVKKSIKMKKKEKIY